MQNNAKLKSSCNIDLTTSDFRPMFSHLTAYPGDTRLAIPSFVNLFN